MGADPLWVDVTALMQQGNDGLKAMLAKWREDKAFDEKAGDYFGRLMTILGIREINLHVEEVTGKDKDIDVVVDIFNRVNSGGTKLSAGDLALAKICADWPEARSRMKGVLQKWHDAGYRFTLDWLLRNTNTVTTGQAKFTRLHNVEPEKVKNGVERVEKAIDTLLNLVAGRLGLDHDEVMFGKYAFPVMAHYLDRRGHLADAVERDRLLLWYLHSALWGRFSGSTESVIDKDLKAIENLDGALDRLLSELQLWHGSLRVVPDHFGGWSLGARFYPLLYLLTRMGEARDWGTGLPLKSHLLGKMNRLEVHHIFPKAVLYQHQYTRSQVNALANFCFLTKDTNLAISARHPEEYFAQVEEKHPGALASQWVPTDPALWKPERYLDFLDARKALLAEAANRFLDELAHGAVRHAEQPQPAAVVLDALAAEVSALPGGIESAEEEARLRALNEWVGSMGLPEGQLLYELSDAQTGSPLAVLDVAWPDGLQAGLSGPVAVLLNEGQATLAVANAHGYRYFTTEQAFRDYVEKEVLAQETGGPSLFVEPPRAELR